MIILWIRKKKTDKNNIIEKKGKQSFEEHDDIMKRFRLEHPDVNVINAKDIFADEGNLLVPVQQVKLPANIQN